MDWKESNNRIDVPYNKNACFISIDYPGIVQNTENAIESLGGAENLSKARMSLVFVALTFF